MRVGLAPAISLAVASWRNNWGETEQRETERMRGSGGGGIKRRRDESES